MPRLQRTHPLVPYAYADHLPGNGSGTGASPSGPGAGAGSASTAPLPSLGSSTDPSSTSVRKIYIQHLTSILHSSLLKSDWPRAERAWAILVRCREVDWYERWRWGLAILNAHARRGDEVEDWLKTLRLSAAEVEKPAILHTLILHYIRTNQYRLALDELDTYLTSYPYILSGPLHSYAGLLCFYLAQPESARAGVGATLNGGEGILDIEGGAGDEGDIRQQGSSEASVGRGDRFTDSYHGHERYEQAAAQAPNATLLKQARTWFIKAIEIAPDAIASEFIHLIDNPPVHSNVNGTIRRATSEMSSAASAILSPARTDGRTTRSMARHTAALAYPVAEEKSARPGGSGPSGDEAEISESDEDGDGTEDGVDDGADDGLSDGDSDAAM